MPMPENTALGTISQDTGHFAEVDGPVGRQPNSSVLRGILKHLYNSSSADSLLSPLDLQNSDSLDSPTEIWIDRKQVRFSSMVSQTGVEWQNGKEMGEHSLLDMDSITPSETENNCVNNSYLELTDCTSSGTHRPILNQCGWDSQEAEVSFRNEANMKEQEAGQQQVLGGVFEHCNPELLGPAVPSFVSAEQVQGKPAHLETEPEEERCSQAQPTDWPTRHNPHPQNLPEQSTDLSFDATSDTTSPNSVSSGRLSHAVSPQPRQRLLGIFRRQKNKIAEVQIPQREGILIQEKELGNTPNTSLSATDTAMGKTASVTHEAKPTEMTEVRTLQLTALQNTSFEETVATVDEDTHKDATKGKAVQFPQRLSDLKAFWERENTGPKIKFLREDTNQGDISKTGADTSHGPKTYVESLDDTLAQNDTIDDTAGRSQENIFLPQTECSLVIVLSNEDGTYRANPVLIYEDTDDSLTGSVTESQEIPPVCSSVVVNAPKQQEGDPVSLPSQSSSSPQENRPAKITELENLRQTEYTEPTENTAIVKNALISSILGAKMVSTQSDQRTPLDNIAESEGEQPKSPCKTNLKVTDKGFVTQSPERPQLSGSGSAGDLHSTCHQQVKADAESRQRPLSPGKSKMPRSKDPDEEVRMSPSKTCHPRVLPRESAIPTRSRLEDSPLKTFSIDINPQTKAFEEQQRKPSPVPRQRKSPSQGAKQTALTDIKPSTDIPLCPLPLHAEDREDNYDNINTQQSNSSSAYLTQSKLRTFTRLARSFIPQDYQHYLGPQKRAHVPPFHQEKEVTGYDESPIRSALKRLSSRVSSSKSLENLTSQPREEMTKHESRQQSVDDVSSLPPSASALSSSKQKKTSVSVPVLQQDETDSDSTFETNLGWRRNTGSSTSNISLSSGMASMLSISGSTSSSIFPGDLGDIEVQGNIQFAVNYIQKLGEFHIFVVHCRELAVADTKKSRSDPYVKCYLLPDKTKFGKRKTTVKKKTVNPNYNEILRFKIIIEVLKTQNLNVSVWHNDTFGRNSFLGEVELDLSEWDFSNTQINEYTLKSRLMSAHSSNHPSPSHLMDSSGQMRVALRFLPQTSHSKRTSRMETGEVQIWVKDCKNLPSVRGVIIDPFVKCTVLPDTSRKIRQKTRVVKRTANPMFNHTMVYDGFRTEDLREACVEVTVWDHDRLSSHYIGGLRLGLGTGKSYGLEVVWMDSSAAEADLWQRMLESDGEWVEEVLPLRMFVLAKSMSK
ncbi:synaptotagmin-like protein 2 isoform X2 [Platichthys flesus]|uniref:synaptotagmin-like protein 2 isoform X2 n=1 Tax=Platichthys flesus TaxID=8260 RepID=UPI002DC00869|nr:synaptotagmin-like protein 2 isoform X2 [Platichthys flesus]